MARPLWNGHLSFGLVMIPVTLYSAEEPLKELDFDLLDARDLSRVRYIRVNESTGREVEWKTIVKGVKRGGEYIPITNEDFQRAAKEITKGLEIVKFVKKDEISPLMYSKPYYLLPGKGGEKVYVLLRETLKKADEVGIARLVIRTREHLAALMVVDDMLTLMTLRFPEELRAPEDIGSVDLSRVKVQAKEVEMARQLVSGMTAEFEPGEFHDRYRDALRSIIEKKSKAKGHVLPPIEEDEDKEAPTQDVMELLRRSLEGRGARHGTRNGSHATRNGTHVARRVHRRRKAG